MKCVTDFGTYDVNIHKTLYRDNGNLAIVLDSPTEGPFATLTVNLVNYGKLPEGYAFLDTNNCPWAERFVKLNELGEDTGLSGASGYCTYPLYKFDMQKLRERGED